MKNFLRVLLILLGANILFYVFAQVTNPAIAKSYLLKAQ